ncbi:hypothetical protein PHYSODRAFT_476226 [Phytophthora sojae]|uniref:Uncharacterized protein n=1 Tax=Phytophthora sojae (strain P6497) TaxID=1094619 RepID=G4YJR9_PHYSP|nr:hypothetical protein PHYSODRAFT_476226 [Phytophthora sojae]EGZ26626.1 hypothetical protein PHYSODRAFT_476226 [Phytophthora sojae]|eukprot:XP_009513901.1 hypothetical protein PHYSODRAFT_476226 [Phytophthora sojae]
MVASPPPPPMELASAAFVHLGCTHAQLFRSEYKRSNRTKGLKILRCFPHCCPKHIDRSYCGTSLSVRVELAARSPGAGPVELSPTDALAVFARFEAVTDASIRPGECVEVAKIAAGTQSESNLDGQWMEGLIDRPSGLITTFRRPDAPVDYQKPLVFHLNGKPLSRWYYDWESGANKAQRLMKHVLKAYVVERCAVDRHGNLTAFTDPQAHTQLYRVSRVVTSPEFTQVSGFPYSSDAHGLFEGNLQWGQTNLPAARVSRNLALAYAFLRWVPMSSYAPIAAELTLLRALTQGIKWLYSEGTWQWLRSFFYHHARSVLDKHALRACFLLLIQELSDCLDAQVFAHTDLKSLDNVAEEVIAAVYTYPDLHARRFQVREILGGRNFIGWNAFMAQIRETYIGMSTSRRTHHAFARRPLRIGFSQVHPARNDIENCWNGEWLLDVNKASWTSSDDVEACKLHVRSNHTIAGSLSFMRIVLDGKERVFSQFPDGMASAVDACLYGDYVGEVRVEHPERFVVYLQVYNWSLSRNDPSYNVHLRIECWRGHKLYISGDTLATTAPTTYMTDEETSLWGEMSLRTKQETMSEVHARYLQEHSRARWNTSVAAEPWKEVGRFRLTYAKV